jgi:hypothetical protein
MHVTTEPTPRPPFVVTLVFLPEPSERSAAGVMTLGHHVEAAVAGLPEQPDGEPTWEDAAWY